MVRQTYYGLGSREAAVTKFDTLKPFWAELRRLQGQCKPFGRDYLALGIALDALETAAFHFTRRPHFYGSQSDSVGPLQRRVTDEATD